MILVACSDHGIAIFAKILKTIFDMILIVGPILAIVSLAYLMFCVITSSDADSKDVYKKRIKNALLALVIVVFLPVFVNLVMSATFMKNTFQVAQCWSEASKVSFSKKTSDYIKKGKSGKQNTGTMIIDPGQYHGINGDPNASISGGTETGSIETNAVAGNRESQIQGAISWAIAIANDDSFAYGPKPYSSRAGCYFCKTNGGKAKAAKGHPEATPPKGMTWDKTYVCMTFVNAAYAHGAKDPIFLKYCKRGSTALDGNARVKKTLKNLGNRVTYMGKPAYNKLEAGDILFMEGKHVSMYIGNGKFAEATGRGWKPSSIAVKKLSKGTYSKYTSVLRYNGY